MSVAADQPPNRFRWGLHLFLLALYPIAVALLSRGQGPTGQPALGHDPGTILMIVLVELSVFGVVFLLAWLASRATWDDLMLRWRGGLWTVPLGIAYSIALRFALAIPVILVAAALVAMNVTSADQLQSFVLHNRPDVDAVVDVAALRENPVYFWLSATLVSFVLGGLREELWRAGIIAGMRRLWPSLFGSTIGGLGASLIAAVAFGLGHLSQGPLAAVLTGMLGFGLGSIMIAHRSIWPAVIAHGAFNAASMALIPWVIQQVPSL